MTHSDTFRFAAKCLVGSPRRDVATGGVDAVENDAETGLYYLRSRYYSPEWGRFINADAILGNTGVLFSHNVFAYCENSCVMSKDPEGLRHEATPGGGGSSLKLTQQQIAKYNLAHGTPGTNKRYRSGKGNIIFPKGRRIEFEWTSIAADYHIDAFLHSKAIDVIRAEIADRGRNWGGDYPIPVMLEMNFDDKKGNKSTLYTFAAMEPWPHFGGSTTIAKDGEDDGAHVNVWVINSMTTAPDSIGRYNDVVNEAPGEFASAISDWVASWFKR